ncbi:MAG: hypothetical protein AB7L71_14310 [Vicinamibacterales bacterium]
MRLRAAIAGWVVALVASGCSSPTAPPKPPVVDPSSAPLIQSISVPTSRVETGQNVAISAEVVDAETPLTQLVYAWTASAGTITGTGATATWTHPAGITSGVDVTVTLTVTDTYDAVENNQIVKKQYVVSRTSSAFRVHDSEAESKELARRFLIDLFGNSNIPAGECLIDFADVCADVDYGKNDEFDDIVENRQLVNIRSATMMLQRLDWRSADFGHVHNAVVYDDYYLDGRPKAPTCGDFEITVVYVNGRWWICTSRYFSQDQTGCPAGVDNAVAVRTLGDKGRAPVDVFQTIMRRLKARIR